MAKLDGYAEEFEQAARAVKEAAGWRCESCGVVDGTLATTRHGRRKGRQHIIYLQAAHLDRNDTANPKPRLAALCPTCHGVFDHGTPQQQALITQAIQASRQQQKRGP